MKVVTIQIEAGASRQLQVSLYAGAPGSHAAEPVAQATRTALAIDEIRKEVLERSGDAEEIGVRLGKWLLEGAIGDKWNELREDAGGLRTYLDVRRALQAAPWEFARFDERTLFLEGELPFSIYRHTKCEGRKPEWGIRVLVVIAAKDANDEIGTWREVYGIREAVQKVNRVVDVFTLKWPSRDKLRENVQAWRPHVLHIIGHGNNEGLLLYDGTGQAPWKALEVGNDLDGWSWKPEVVYLNTCRSAGAPSGGGGDASSMSIADQGGQWTVVDRFLEKGVAAVIAMQADVKGSLAGACAGEFYRGIAESKPLDVALVRGRQAIARKAPDHEAGPDPYLPKLIVARPVEEILRYKAQIDLAESPELITALETFVDRDDKRREMVELLENGRPVVVVHGQPEVGKTWLLRWCIDAWRRREMNVRYIPISGCGKWLNVVQRIRDGDPTFASNPASVSLGLGPESRALLNWRLNALTRGIADPPTDTFTGMEVEEKDRIGSLLDSPPPIIDAHIRAMAALHAALQQEAGQWPLVIVLDNFSAGDRALTEGHFTVLQKHWIDTFVTPGTSNVRVVLGLNSAQMDEYNLRTLPQGYVPVDLGYFAKDQFSDIALVLLPLLYQFGDDKEKALEWLRGPMAVFDPEFDNQRLSGPVLRERCKLLWGYCQGMKGVWKKP